jgi:protein-tyrosine phosphatase
MRIVVTSFRALAVCTGNVCRSPMIERLLVSGLRARVGDLSGRVEIASAGTAALVGAPMAPGSAELVRRHGGDADGHRARNLDAGMVRSADLVLTAERAHRRHVATLHPVATRYTFTLRELTRLLGAGGAPQLPHAELGDRLRALVPILASRRGLTFVPDAAEDDLVDAYGRDQAAYDEMAGLLAPAVSALIDAVAPAPGS